MTDGNVNMIEVSKGKDSECGSCIFNEVFSKFKRIWFFKSIDEVTYTQEDKP